jgi:hypothetical protein
MSSIYSLFRENESYFYFDSQDMIIDRQYIVIPLKWKHHMASYDCVSILLSDIDLLSSLNESTSISDVLSFITDNYPNFSTKDAIEITKHFKNYKRAYALAKEILIFS